MKVFIKNKLISLAGDSQVVNEQGEAIFKVKGKVVSPTRKKFIYDMQDKLLYVVRNKYWNFFANRVFIYNDKNERVATIKKSKWSFNFKYQIEDCVDSMSIQGKIFSGKNFIIRNEEQIGEINREFSLFADSFMLEAQEQDIPFLTALVVAFDNLKDQMDKERD